MLRVASQQLLRNCRVRQLCGRLQDRRSIVEDRRFISVTVVSLIVLYFTIGFSHTGEEPDRSLYIVSARYDPRAPDTVQFGGLVRRGWKQSLYFHFASDSRSASKPCDTNSMQRNSIDSDSNTDYDRFVLNCTIPADVGRVSRSTRVTLSLSKALPAADWLPLVWIVGAAEPMPVLRPTDASELLVTDAFYDPRFPRLVRLWGIGRVMARKKQLFCHFHTGTTVVSMPGKLTSIFGSMPFMFHHSTYDGFFIECPIHKSVRGIHVALRVSVSESKVDPGHKKFALIMVPAHPPSVPSIASCVSPIYLHKNNSFKMPPAHLAAWIEMNRLLGVEHFLLYDFKIPSEMRNLLAYYQAQGIVTLLKWNTHPIPTALIGVWPPYPNVVHYYGQMAAYNDCLYRLGNRYRYLMFTDLDEMLIPTADISLNDFLSSSDKERISEFIFRSTFVSTRYPKNTLASRLDPTIGSLKVPLLDTTRRENRVFPSNMITKAIVKFENTLVMGVHTTIRATDIFKASRDVSPDEGLCYHYRYPGDHLDIGDPGHESQRLIGLVPKLVAAVKKVLRHL